MTQDRPVVGVLLMLGFCVLAPMGDSVAKLLGGRIGVTQLVTIRFAIQLLILVPLVMFTGRSLRMRGRLLWLALLRTLLHIIGIGAMFTSLIYLPLADAVAIAFVMPFILLILGHFLLSEEVGSRRIAACCVGFIGTLFVIQPSFSEVGLPAILPLVVAVDFAFFMLVTRQIAKEVDPVELQAVSGGMAVAMLIPVLLLAAPYSLPGLELTVPDKVEWLLLLALGVFGTSAHLLMTWSLRFAPSATLAPMQYLEIPVAAFLGWLVFRDFPDDLALIGIGIMIGAGVYILMREQAVSRLSRRQAPRGAPPAAE